MLFLLGAMFSASTFALEDHFSGSFSITVPGDRLLSSMQLEIDLPDDRSLKMEQNQKSDRVNSMIQVGRLPRMTLNKNRKGNIKLKNSQMSSISALFYIYDNVERLDSFSIEPKFYSKANEFHTTGTTDRIFSLEFLELNAVGDLEGTLLKKIDALEFKIGQPNVINVNLLPEIGKKIAVRLSAASTSTNFLHLPVNKQGEYPCNLVDDQNRLISTTYTAPVRFTYTLSRASSHSQNQNIVLRRLVREVNHFLSSHPDRGSSKIIEVPIKLNMSLAAVNAGISVEASSGPFKDINKNQKTRSRAKRKRGFFGF